MKNLSAISLMMLSLTITGCGDSRIKEFKNGFMESCTGGAPEDICACSYDAIEDHYTDEQLIKLSEGRVPSDFLDFTQKAALQCVKDNS
jgi:hypothetical protein